MALKRMGIVNNYEVFNSFITIYLQIIQTFAKLLTNSYQKKVVINFLQIRESVTTQWQWWASGEWEV